MFDEHITCPLRACECKKHGVIDKKAVKLKWKEYGLDKDPVKQFVEFEKICPFVRKFNPDRDDSNLLAIILKTAGLHPLSHSICYFKNNEYLSYDDVGVSLAWYEAIEAKQLICNRQCMIEEAEKYGTADW